MPLYSYEGIDSAKRRQRGLLEAENEKEIKEKLRAQNLIVLSISLKHGRSKYRLSKEGVIAFTRELADLLSSSLPLYESLLSLEEKHRGEKNHALYLALSERIKEGDSLKVALRAYPDIFSPFYLAMVESGEAVGNLGEALTRLADFLKEESNVRKKITSALFYPFILLSFSLLLLGGFLFFLVPSLEELFQDRKLSALTTFVFSLSHFLREEWFFYLPLLAIITLAICFVVRHPKTKERTEKLLFKNNTVKRIYLEGTIATFSRTLGILLTGGVSLVNGLNLAKKSISSTLLLREFDRIEGRVIEGSSLSRELVNTNYFPPLFLRMVAIGEEGGKLPRMLLKVADIYDEEREKRLSRFVTLLPPFCLLFLGAWIAMIVLAILLPLTDVSGFLNN